MSLTKKILLAVAVFAAALLALFIAVQLFIDQHAVKEKISAEIAQRLNARVSIGRISLAVWGMPGIRIRAVTAEFTSGLEISIKQAVLYPAASALLRGQLNIKKLTVQEPVIRLPAAAFSTKRGPPKALSKLQKKAVEALTAAREKIPGLLQIDGGVVHLQPPGNAKPLRLYAVAAKLTKKPNLITLSLRGNSRLWRQLHLEGRFPESSSPDVLASGTLLTLDIAGLNIASVREAASAAAGINPAAENILKRLKGGTLSRLTCELRLPIDAEPVKSGALSLSADFDAVTISFPEAGPGLTNLSGSVVLRDGLLEAARLKGAVGSSRFDNATLMLDAALGYAPVSISAAVVLDLEQAPFFLSFIPPARIKNELALFESPRGTARGSCTIIRENNSYRADVALRSLSLTAAYRNFPMPIEIDSGSCSFRKPLLTFTDLSGRVGSSAISNLSASFDLAGEHTFRINSRDSALDIKELHGILDSFSPTRNFLRKLKRAEGLLQVGRLELSGPIAMAQQWDYDLQASLHNAVFSYAGMDGEASCPAASLAANHKTISIAEAKVAYLESDFQGSATLKDYQSGFDKLALAGRGTLGRQLTDKIFTTLKLPQELMIRTPVEITKAQLTRAGSDTASFSGDFIFDRSVRAGIELQVLKKGFTIKRLSVKGGESNSTARLNFHKNGISLAYTGLLTGATLDRILVSNPYLQGWAQGDFKAEFNRHTPLASTASGALAWEQAGYPGIEQLPLQINKASVTADGDGLYLHSASISTRDSLANISGAIGFSERGFLLDMQVAADKINLDEIKKALQPDTQTGPDTKTMLTDIPVRGSAAVYIGELILGGYRLSPCTLVLSLTDKQLKITSVDTRLCSIPLPAKILITPDYVDIEAAPATKSSSMEDVVKCLIGGKALITGQLSAQSDIKAHGAPAALAESVRGAFSIKGRNGRIYRSNLLTKLLSFLSIRQLLTGDILNIAEKGYAYETLRIKGEVLGRSLQINEAVLISTSLNLVCQGSIDLKTRAVELDALATPFQIVDYLLSKIPFLGAAFKKTVIGVPLHIGGTIDNPQLTPRAPTAIGRELTKLATDILKLPIRLINPPAEKPPPE